MLLQNVNTSHKSFRGHQSGINSNDGTISRDHLVSWLQDILLLRDVGRSVVVGKIPMSRLHLNGLLRLVELRRLDITLTHEEGVGVEGPSLQQVSDDMSRQRVRGWTQSCSGLTPGSRARIHRKIFPS